MRTYFEQCQKAFGKNLYNDFMLANGQEYNVGPNTFKGPRNEPHMCFSNAFWRVLADHSLTYVEGKIAIHGVPIDHAWCVGADGVVVDPTIKDVGQVLGYFGVPFLTDYVKRAVIENEMYGVLDYFYASKTAPKLFELGLVEGQKWLLEKSPTRRKAAKRKAGVNAPKHH